MHETDNVIRKNSLEQVRLALSLSPILNCSRIAKLLRQCGESLSAVAEMNDCTLLSDAQSAADELPTRQKNALRLLLSKPVISPEEVAKLDYRVLERAPGVGKKSIDIIRAWLNSQGFELTGLPESTVNQRVVQRKRKLERAIDYQRWHGYEVHRSRQ